ncbi:MAG: cell division protein SepF [Candidatus Micrarchaeota archaeon]|nr:cell division protein SepF [Candidatus Micrarchaeota archaeon]
MGILQRLSKLLGLSKEMDLEEYLDTAELENVDVLHEGADRFVKPIALESEADVSVVEHELSRGNIVLLNFGPLSKQQTRLKNVITELKEYVVKINGDVARIKDDTLILTPEGIKIVKRKR